MRIFQAARDRLSSLGHLMWRGNPEEEKKPVPHWFHFPLQALIVGVLVYWHSNLPLPSKAVLYLAAVAALMVLAEMRPIHKAIYVVVIIALVATENRAINDDRAKFERDAACRRKEENAQFQKIVDGLKDSLTLNQQQFQATMNQFDRNMNTITGGNGFAVVWAPLLEINENGDFSLILNVRGHYDLQDVHVEVVQLPEPGFGTREWAQRSLTGKNPYVKTADLGNVSHAAGKPVPITVRAASDGSITEYSINVFARNRTTHESLRIRKNLSSGEWESSFKVIDGDTYKLLEQSKPEWRGFKLLSPK